MKFTTTIGQLENNVYYEHIIVPAKIHDKLVTDDGNKRVMCSINGAEAFHAGLMPKGDGHYFIIMSKARLKKYKLSPGDNLDCLLYTSDAADE